MSCYCSSDYVGYDKKPRWDAFGKLLGELRQFVDDIRPLNSISDSVSLRNARGVINGQNYTDAEKAAAIKYLDKRKKLVDAKLKGVDYSTLIEQVATVIENICILERFDLSNADIGMLDAQYCDEARVLRDTALAEAKVKEQAEREKYEKEHNEKLDKNFRIASALIEKAFGDVDVTRTSYRGGWGDTTAHSLSFPVWMFNDDTDTCYCVDIQRGSENYKNKWFYSVMRSCDVLPMSVFHRYDNGITSGNHYQVKALSCDLKKVLPIYMKYGHFTMSDDLLNICADDHAVQPLHSFVDIDINDLDDNIVESNADIFNVKGSAADESNVE